MNAEHRRLRARATKLEDDNAILRERLAAAYQEVAAVRAKVPVNVHQVSFKAASRPVASDPLARLFAALRITREGGS